MIEVVGTLFWALASTEGSQDPETFLEKKKRATPRGYYGYPVLPYAEPLTILAGLAFIAYVIQAFHALYHHNHGMGGGGILNNVLPGKGRNTFPKVNNLNETLKD